MSPSSHAAPIINAAPDALHSQGLLADAFSEFISASSLLEASYRDLQREVSQLGFELAERNAALTRSLAENDRMRAALQQIIESMPCGVLVLDTAADLFGGNENDRAQVRAFIGGLNRMAQTHNLAVVDVSIVTNGAV